MQFYVIYFMQAVWSISRCAWY